MTLEQGGALAEIVFSIAVICSLIFVGYQLKLGNKEAGAKAVQDAMRFEMDYSLAFATAPAIWEKVIKGHDMDDVELRHAILLFNAFICETENRFNQYKLGYLEQQTWDARIGTLKDIRRLPIYRQWRNSYGGKIHAPEFLAVLDAQLKGYSPHPEEEGPAHVD